MRLSSLLPANVVTANFCEVELTVNHFLPLLQAPLIKVKVQFLLWQRFCQNYSDVVVWKRAYKLCQLDIFPVIKLLLSILATFLVSSATVERSFSTLRLIKSNLQTTMCQARLHGLCLILLSKNLLPQIVKKFLIFCSVLKSNYNCDQTNFVYFLYIFTKFWPLLIIFLATPLSLGVSITIFVLPRFFRRFHLEKSALGKKASSDGEIY